MATISEISNLDSYKGDSGLGGSNEIAIQLDTKPIQQLAAYTLMYNKSQYDQRQKDADEKIVELGKLTRFDAINGLPKDLDAVKTAKLKLQEISTKYASEIPGSPKQKQESYLKYQQEKAEIEKTLNSANARDIKLKAYINATQIDKDLTTEQKTLNIKQAQKLFDDSDVYTLPVIPEFKITTPKVGTPVYDKVQYFKEDAGGNFIIDETRDEYSFTGNAKMGYLEANDLMGPTLPANATEQQKAEYEQKKLAFSQSKMGGWKTATQFYGEALNNSNYKKTVTTTGINVMGELPTTALTEEIDIEKIKAANPLAGGIIQMGEAYNNDIQKKIDRLEKQQYDNSITGKKPLFTQGTDTPQNLKSLLIDVTKPLSPEQLVQLARFEQARPDKVEMKLIQHDNAIQKEGLRIRWAEYGLTKQKLDQADNEDLLAADGVLREITDIINKGDMANNQVDVVDGNTGSKKRVFKIGDPNILQKFANVDKDGTTTNVPDEARYNSKTNEIDLVYFVRDDDGKVKPTNTGGSYIREQKTLNARTWANMVSQRTFSGQDRGKVNEIIQSVITKNGGDLFRIAKLLNPSSPATTATTTTGQPSKKEINRSDISAKASAAGYSAKEYEELLKKNGVTIKD